MQFISVSEAALDSIKRLAQEDAIDAARWRWCAVNGFPWVGSEGRWICPEPCGTYHFAPTSNDAVDMAMKASQ